MSLVLAFAKGVGIGLAVAAPVGPVALLCIRRTLTQGTGLGFASGLGAATADGMYGFLALFAVSLITALGAHHEMLRLFGGLLLLWMAAAAWQAPLPVAEARAPSVAGYAGAWASTFGITASNPLTVAGFVGVVSAFGTAEGTGPATALVFGVFFGSALWWLALTMVVGRLRTRLGSHAVSIINKASAVVLALFALVALVSLAIY